jgi:transketolase
VPSRPVAPTVVPLVTPPVSDPEILRGLAARGRRHVIEAVARAGAGHIGGPLSCMDILVALYFSVLRVDPRRPDWPERDRLILSKGHAALALYAVLAMRGFFPPSWLDSFDQLGSPLQGHPDAGRCPGVDMSTGSLGQGLSAGLGMALGAERRGLDCRVFVLLGDGECQEGQVWEAVHAAARYRAWRLRAVVDCNGLPQYAWPGSAPSVGERLDLAPRFAAFGWDVVTVDGHDPEALLEVLPRQPQGDVPLAILARTHKGQGVSFMRDQASWHARVPSAAERTAALQELAAAEAGLAVAVGDSGRTGAARSEAPAPRDGVPPAAHGGEDRWRPHVGAAGEATVAPEEAQRVVFGQVLRDEMARDPRILLLDGDLANSTRADIVAEAWPERFLEMGIAEQNLVGAAAGLATMGFRPWVSTFAVFAVERALDQVRMHVAQMHLPVRVAGGYSGLLTGFTGKTHQSVEDLAIMRAMPGMAVLAPADALECAAAIRWAAAHPGPVYLRLARDPVPPVFPAPPGFDPTRAHWLRRGRDLTLVSTGVQSGRVLQAALRCAASGIDAAVLHLPALKPFDRAALREAGQGGLVVTVEEHSVLGGLGSLVAEVLAETAPTRVVRWGLPDVFGESGSNAALLNAFGLSAERLEERIRRLVHGEADLVLPDIPPFAGAADGAGRDA